MIWSRVTQETSDVSRPTASKSLISVVATHTYASRGIGREFGNTRAWPLSLQKRGCFVPPCHKCVPSLKVPLRILDQNHFLLYPLQRLIIGRADNLPVVTSSVATVSVPTRLCRSFREQVFLADLVFSTDWISADLSFRMLIMCPSKSSWFPKN